MTFLNLTPKTQNDLFVLADAFKAEGHQFFVVGGAVRDYLCGQAPHDVDAATDATPSQMAAVADKAGVPVDFKAADFGTVVFGTGSSRFEVTTFRKESGYTDGRHPDRISKASSIEEDLARRDLTVNAMAMDAHGHLVDPFGGASDLKAGTIRAVGNAQDRISEDAIRALRAMRFGAKLGFSVDTNLIAACGSADLSSVSKERIRSEMDQIFFSDNVDCVAGAMAESDLLGAVCRLAGTGLREGSDVASAISHLGMLSREPFERLASLGSVVADIGLFMEFYGYSRMVRRRADLLV